MLVGTTMLILANTTNLINLFNQNKQVKVKKKMEKVMLIRKDIDDEGEI